MFHLGRSPNRDASNGDLALDNVKGKVTIACILFQFKREQLGGGIYQVIAGMLRTSHVFLPYLLIF
jgi:hypothetical protein